MVTRTQHSRLPANQFSPKKLPATTAYPFITNKIKDFERGPEETCSRAHEHAHAWTCAPTVELSCGHENVHVCGSCVTRMFVEDVERPILRQHR